MPLLMEQSEIFSYPPWAFQIPTPPMKIIKSKKLSFFFSSGEGWQMGQIFRQ
jgi:hypothetical protein